MSGFQKNVSGQKWLVFAFNRTNNTPRLGDAANITAKLRKDHGTATAVGDTNPTEIEDGYYEFDLTQAETNANVLDLLPESSTADIQVIGVPGRVFTVPANFTELGIESDGDLTKVNTLDGHTAQTGDSYARIGAGGASLSAVPWNTVWDAEVQSEVNDGLVALGLDHLIATSVTGTDVTDDSIVARLVSSSATADWDTFVNTDDSLQAISEGGGGGPTAADIADAVWDESTTGHTTAGTFGEQLKTDVDAILSDTNELQGDWADGGRLDVILDAINDGTPASLTTGTADSGTTTSLTDSALNQSDDDYWTGMMIRFTSGNISGQARMVTNFNEATDTITFTPATTQAVSTNTYEILPFNLDAIWKSLSADHGETGTMGEQLINKATSTQFNTLDGKLDDVISEIGTRGAGLSAIPWNIAWDAEVQSECNDALVALGLDHLLSASVVGADIVDNSIFARLVSSSATADWDDFANTTDSLQAIRDQGDSAWLSAVGFSTHSAADVWTNVTRTLTGLGFTLSAADFATASLNGKGDWNTTTPDPKKNQAFMLVFPMVLSSDHATAATGLTVSAQVSKDGGSLVAAGTVTEIGNGLYKLELTADQMNADIVAVTATAATADTRNVIIATNS